MRETEKLVTIARYENGFEAELSKLALDNRGIPCFLAGNDNLPYPTLITVELQVFESDVDQAKELLEQRDAIEEPEEGNQ